MRVALVTIATGPRYHKFIKPLIKSVRKYFVAASVFLWTDRLIDDFTAEERPEYWISKESSGFPNETLYRYHTFLSMENELAKFDQIFYCDIDMLFVSKVGDIFSDGITATLHPGFISGKAPLTLERRPESTAYCPNGKIYYCGGFNGGSASRYLAMAKKIRDNIDIDASRGITAIWHDESHLNRYLYFNPPAKTLGPSYCYPEDYVDAWEQKRDYGWHPEQYPPILVALDKAKHDND